MTKILVAGDWHGAVLWAKAVINRAAELGIDTIYHVGDFGIMGTNALGYVGHIAKHAKAKGVTIYVTPGNHEDYVTLNAIQDAYPGVPAPLTKEESIFILPRGYRWEIDGVSFVSLGGAPSIDRDMRQRYVDWWPEEVITYGDALRTIQGGYADIMITHDAPLYGPGKVYDIIYNSPDAEAFWGADVLRYCRVGHEILNAVYEQVKPRLLFHGHYHVWDHWSNGEQDVIGLQMEGRRRNTVIFDLDDFKAGNIKVEPSGAYIHT